MICYKIKKGFDQCANTYASKWVQRIVLLNRADIVGFDRTKFGVNFITKDDPNVEEIQVGGLPFDYSSVLHQVIGTVEVQDKNNYKQYRHNVQLPIQGFEQFDVLEPINRGDYFAALMDFEGKVWIFGFDFGLKPDDYLYQHIEMDTLTLRSTNLEDTPALRYLGDDADFWNNFIDVQEPGLRGSFNDDFNDDFDNIEI